MFKAAWQKYQVFQPFTDEEAWVLFKLAAIGEAIGWTLLIFGIFLTDYVFKSRVPVVLAGRTHGTLFLIYLTAVLILAPSLKWSWRKTFLAGLVSVPPYGTLIFELWASHARRKNSLSLIGRNLSYYTLIKKAVT